MEGGGECLGWRQGEVTVLLAPGKGGESRDTWPTVTAPSIHPRVSLWTEPFDMWCSWSASSTHIWSTVLPF